MVAATYVLVHSTLVEIKAYCLCLKIILNATRVRTWNSGGRSSPRRQFSKKPTEKAEERTI